MRLPVQPKLITCLAAGLLFSQTSFADGFLPNCLQQSWWHPIMTWSLGAAFNNDAGPSNSIPPHNGVLSFYNYSANHYWQTIPVFGALLGAEFELNPNWALQGGVSYYKPSALVAKGSVTQGADVASENTYTYQYDIQSTQVMLEGKLLYAIAEKWHPYISAGVGSSWNASQNYAVDIQPVFTTFSNQFGNKTVTSFTYLAGLGVDMDITPSARLGIGYRFTDLGNAKLAPATIDGTQTTNTLSQSHLYVNEVLAQFTFDLA
jgi:opacity protein-like surface antigen